MTNTSAARAGALALVTALGVVPGTLRLGAQAPAAPPVVGRWDLRVTGPDGVYPSWLEVTRSGDRALVGRFVGRVGSARPIGSVAFAGGVLRFAIPPQWEEGTGDLRVEGTLSGDRLSGTLVTPGGARHAWTATRAPDLWPAAAPRWGAPLALFNGRDLAGWVPRGGENRWRAVDGVLTNTGAGANLATTRGFGDFKLHVEVRYPPHSNSGVYLRGRYEVQVEDDEEDRRDREPAPVDIGGVYGFLAPTAYAARPAGEWQSYDITLVGRRVTVVLNGRTVVADQPIPGITGGALDSDEGAPGPILLQGDHGRVEYRNLVLTPGGPAPAGSAQTRPAQAPDTGRFEAEVRAFEVHDAEAPPAPGAVLFVGSSSVRLWGTLDRDFADLRVLNRGFGGSTMGEVLRYAPRLVLPYRPRTVVVYAGDNDLAEGRTPAEVHDAFRQFVALVHERLPGARVVYLAVKPSPARVALLGAARATNALVQADAGRDLLLAYVDVFTPMLRADGRPRAELFGADGLHMNAAGYALWRSVLGPVLGARVGGR